MRLKPVSLSGNPSFSTFHLFSPSLRHIREPWRSLTLQQVRREGGRGAGEAGETPVLGGKGKAPSSAARTGGTKHLLCGGSRATARRWRRAALAAEPRGSPAIRGGRGGGDPAAGKLRLHLPSQNELRPKGSEKSPPTGNRSPREGGIAAPRGGGICLRLVAKGLSPGVTTWWTGGWGTPASLPQGFVHMMCLSSIAILETQW